MVSGWRAEGRQAAQGGGDRRNPARPPHSAEATDPVQTGVGGPSGRGPLIVGMACDQRFAPYAACVAERFVDLHPDLPVVIASEAPLDLPPHLGGRGITNLVIADNPFLEKMTSSRIGSASYLRLAMQDALRPLARRLFYIDADIHIEAGGLRRLASMDLHGAAVGAVRDNQQWRRPDRRVGEWKALGWPALPYFNAGMMLVDLDEWARHDLTDRCLDVHRTMPHALVRQNQSRVNIALGGRWAEMSPVWNWQMTRATRHFADGAGARILHFIGPTKPWAPGGAQPLRFAAPFDAYLATHYPDLPRPPLTRARIDAPARAAFWRHWLGAAATERYLSRFPDPWTTLPPSAEARPL